MKSMSGVPCGYAKDLAKHPSGEFPPCPNPAKLTISNEEWEEDVCIDHAMILVYEYRKDLEEQGLDSR